MFETPANQKTVTIKLKRRNVIDMMLASTENSGVQRRRPERAERNGYTFTTC